MQNVSKLLCRSAVHELCLIQLSFQAEMHDCMVNISNFVGTSSIDAMGGTLYSSQSSDVSPSVGFLLQTTDQNLTEHLVEPSEQWYFDPGTCEPNDNFLLSFDDDSGIMNMLDMFNDFV